MILLSTLLISLFATIALIPLFKELAVKLKAIDLPDQRKVHSAPMPRSGGIAMAFGAVIPVLLWLPLSNYGNAVLLGSGVVVLFGFIDDFRPLDYKIKFLAQVVAASIVVFYGKVRFDSFGTLLPEGVLLPAWLAVALTIIMVVGVTNAINLADGLDGLAGGISLLSFMCIGYLAYKMESFEIAILACAISGATFGFLRFNTYPAIIFMGDAGSQLLGFLGITLSLGLVQGTSPLSPFLPLILLGFPILDTVFVALERTVRGHNPFMADKNHFHHKLMRLGLFHTESVFVIYLLQALLVTYAFLFRFHSEWFLLSSYAIFSGVILSLFYASGRWGWRFSENSLIARILRRQMDVLKRHNGLIKISFWTVESGLPAIVIFTCFAISDVPNYYSIISGGIGIILLLIWGFKKAWLGAIIRVFVYLMIPFIVYFSQLGTPAWMSARTETIYNVCYGLMGFFVIFTLKFTRRKKGFKSSPFDFIILFMALVVPNLPDEQIQSFGLGLVAAKIIVLFFSYEILIGELRGSLDKLAFTTLAALLVLAIL